MTLLSLVSCSRVFVSTWNVGGVVPSDDLNLEDWLDTENNSYDIYVLGYFYKFFQSELVRND